MVFRKFTALTFMLVMTLLITLKHPVLGYCLCLDAFFAGDCVCQVDTKTITPDSQVKESGCCSSCETAPAEAVSSELAEQTPCNGCTEHLNIDVGDFIWQNTQYVSTDDSLTAPSPVSFEPQSLAYPKSHYSPTTPIRGGPPPGHLAHLPPLYLRLAVLRL